MPYVYALGACRRVLDRRISNEQTSRVLPYRKRAQYVSGTLPPPPDVYRDDDGIISIVFGPGVTAGALVQTFASVPSDSSVEDITARLIAGTPVTVVHLEPARVPGPDLKVASS
jgi:hypothetical protein